MPVRVASLKCWLVIHQKLTAVLFRNSHSRSKRYHYLQSVIFEKNLFLNCSESVYKCNLQHAILLVSPLSREIFVSNHPWTILQSCAIWYKPCSCSWPTVFPPFPGKALPLLLPVSSPFISLCRCTAAISPKIGYEVCSSLMPDSTNRITSETLHWAVEPLSQLGGYSGSNNTPKSYGVF